MKLKKNEPQQATLQKIITRSYLLFTLGCASVIFLIVIAMQWYLQTSAPIFRLDELVENAPNMTDSDFIHMDKKYYLGENGVFFLLDENGSMLYTNDANLYSDFLASELNCIQDYNSTINKQLTEYRTDNGDIRYLLLIQNETDSVISEIVDYTVFDEHFNILGGTLFDNKKQLTPNEISCLMASIDNTYKKQKYKFQNPDGQTRIIVATTYNELSIKDTQFANIIINGCLAFIILGCMLVLLYGSMISKQLSRVILSFNHQLGEFKQGTKFSFSKDGMSSELIEIADYVEQLTEKIQQCEWEKKYLNTSRKKLIADISHDFKTPITVIQGYARALKDDLVAVEEQKLYLDLIYTKAERLDELIQIFSEYSMLEHPDMPMNFAVKDICNIVQVYFANKYEELEVEGFPLYAEIPDEPLRCKIDQVLFFRVLENLMNNTLKYNPKGTAIHIRVEDDIKMINLYIGDTGIGIPDEISKVLFEPFVTGDNCRSSKNGAGLGLAISKKIITLHHGRIELLSPPTHNCSTEYIIQLPKI